MSGVQTYHVLCNGCGKIYRPPAAPNRQPPKRLAAVRVMARSKGWSHAIVPVKQGGPSPSLDFCKPCTDTEAAVEVADGITEADALAQHGAAVRRGRR